MSKLEYNIAAVRETLDRLDVDLKGVARIEDLEGTELHEEALRLLPGTRSIVVVAMEIYPEFLDLTSPEMTTGEANLNDLYRRHTDYQSGRLTHAAYQVAEASHRAGFRALPLPAQRTPTDRRTLRPVISLKRAAEAAGLGKVGMSGLLITPEFGPRVRLGLCLTEAPLEPTAPIEEKVCRYCNICVLRCPAHALARPAGDERFAINQFACQAYLESAGGCSECVRLCPIASPRYA